MKKGKRRVGSLEARQSRYGRLFVLPWVIGFVLFFLIPLCQSILFAFSRVTISAEGFLTDFTGLTNLKFAFYEQPQYTDNLGSAVSDFVTSLPIIVLLSLCIAVVLNQKFRGRAVARAIYFIPAIVASGVVMGIFTADSTSTSLMEGGGGSQSMFSSAIDFEEILAGLGLPDTVMGILSTYASKISTLIWSCGVQIILFISGLQTIPESLYEASKIEGATPWEDFWFITFPMLSNILLVVTFYTTIDIFTNAENPVMEQAYNLILNQQNYDQSSAMLWAYFAIIGAVAGLVFFLLNRLFIRRWRVD